VRSIEHLPVELEKLAKEDKLREVPGVGEAIAKKITELVATGKLEFYEKLKAEFPDGISTLLDVPGIGPKTAMALSSELGVKSVDELEQAITSGKVAGLYRLGDKTAENILHQIQALRRKDQRIPLGQALPIVEEIITELREKTKVKNLVPAGSLRRFRETIGDIDLMGTADDARPVIDAFTTLPQVKDILVSGTTKASVVVSG
jgi:DNA polymerase (family 10)